MIQTGSDAIYNGGAVADFRSGELSYGDNRFQHLNYHRKPPELNNFNESSEILVGLMQADDARSHFAHLFRLIAHLFQS